MKVFTPQQMREFDRAATEKYFVPSIVLMENAALRVVEFLEAKFAPLAEKRIVVLCGKGNNGGDGLAIARHLIEADCEKVTVLLAAKPSELKGDALSNYQILRSAADREGSKFTLGQKFSHSLLQSDLISLTDNHYKEFIPVADIIIDALLGTGIRGKVRGKALERALCFANYGTCVAVDIPSGLDSNSGEALHEFAVDAKFTVTFAAPKRGMFVRNGLEHCGEIWIGSIGTPPSQMEEIDTGCKCITREFAHRRLPQRPLDAHKGEAGRVLVVGGSVGMSGAIALASRAALKVGAGLCIAAVPHKVLSTFASSVLEATSHPLLCDEKGRLIVEAFEEVSELWKNVQVVAMGPGISRGQSTLELVRRVVRECPQPLILDADALYALREIAADVKARKAPTILTPHPGEMGELMQLDAKAVNDDRFAVAQACAEKYGAIVVLKGARSLVALPDGNILVNLSGNAGMATGGSGDALTGTIAGLLAQLKDAHRATQLGVYLHGLAGDLCFQIKGNGLIAGDIVAALPLALRDLERDDSALDSINGRLRRLR